MWNRETPLIYAICFLLCVCRRYVQVARIWMSPWTLASFRKLERPIKFLLASSIKIGSTVIKLLIQKMAVLGCGEVMYCWRIVNWTVSGCVEFKYYWRIVNWTVSGCSEVMYCCRIVNWTVTGCSDVMYCWRILNWIPLWNNWSILNRKLIFVRGCDEKRIMKLLLNIITGLSVALSLHPL